MGLAVWNPGLLCRRLPLHKFLGRHELRSAPRTSPSGPPLTLVTAIGKKIPSAAKKKRKAGGAKKIKKSDKKGGDTSLDYSKCKKIE